MRNIINWLEIPVKDMDRAAGFYEAIFKIKLRIEEFPGIKMAVFPHDETGEIIVGGALVLGEGYEPSVTGALPYLNGGDDLGTILSRVAEAGGQVIMPKTSIDKNGFIALFIDTEGNKIGLHSMG